MEVVAIIPARGGSKGIPKKNIRLLGGIPLVAHSIIAANKSKHVSRVYVSTDCADIRRVALEYGAMVIDRPDELSSDSASSESALLHTLKTLKDTEQYIPEITVFLQCTSPFTSAEDIDSVIDKMQSEQADSCFSAVEFHYFIWKNKQISGAEEAVGINHDKRFRLRRQDREAEFLESGAVYAMRTSGFIESKHRFFGKTVCAVTPTSRCLEIDEPADLDRAEKLLSNVGRAPISYLLPSKIKGVVFDFDGVFTDNTVYIDQEGNELVGCNRSDGHGISLLKKTGVRLLILTSERVPIASRRAQKLGVECRHVTQSDKSLELEAWARQNELELSEIIFLGNDINDVACLKSVGCGVVVADAFPVAEEAARFKLSKAGGRGAVRELCDLIISAMPE